MSPRIYAVVAGGLGCLFLASGCNVARLKPIQRGPEGPMTSATHPSRIADERLALDIAVADAREVDLVEQVLTYRAKYHRSLELLRQYYQSHGYADKQAWARFELAGLKRVKPFRYLLDAEIPSDQLKPTDAIPEADALYMQGMNLMRRGGHETVALYDEDLMVEAGHVLRSLIEQYPTSDKIDDAAFFLGEIHKEYLKNQEALAVKWYERAWAWDPHTPHSARFQAAVVYDFRLQDRDRALELYRAVVAEERSDWGNVRFANRRIEELIAEEPAQKPG